MLELAGTRDCSGSVPIVEGHTADDQHIVRAPYASIAFQVVDHRAPRSINREPKGQGPVVYRDDIPVRQPCSSSIRTSTSVRQALSRLRTGSGILETSVSLSSSTNSETLPISPHEGTVTSTPSVGGTIANWRSSPVADTDSDAVTEFWDPKNNSEARLLGADAYRTQLGA